MLARLAATLTTCQTALGVMPSPHTLLFLLIRRKILPSAIPLAVCHSSIEAFAQFGSGTVRICFPLPMRSAITEALQAANVNRFLPPHRHGIVPLQSAAVFLDPNVLG